MYTLICLMPLFWEQPPPTISDIVKQQKMRSRKCFLVFWADFVCDLGYLITIKSCRGRTIFHTVPGRECVGTVDHVGLVVLLSLPLQPYFNMKECSEWFQTIFNRFHVIQRWKKPFLLIIFRSKVDFYSFLTFFLSMPSWPPPPKDTTWQ